MNFVCDLRRLSRCGRATGCNGMGRMAMPRLRQTPAQGDGKSVRKYSIRSVRQARRQGSRMSACGQRHPRLRCFRAGPGDICTLQDHLRHATEKRWRLEQTGIRQWNRNAVLMTQASGTRSGFHSPVGTRAENRYMYSILRNAKTP